MRIKISVEKLGEFLRDNLKIQIGIILFLSVIDLQIDLHF